MFGYFPTYQLGNVLSVQIWERLVADLPDAYDQVERGSFREIYEWLREHLYRHGRKFTPEEMTARVAGGPIDPSRTCATSRTRTRRSPQPDARRASYAARPKRFSARARAFAASASRSRGGAAVTRSARRCRVTWAISSTARTNAASFAFDGCVEPLTLRTYWSAAAWISSSVAGDRSCGGS